MTKDEFIKLHGKDAWELLVNPMLVNNVRRYCNPSARATEEDVIDHDVIGRMLELLGFKSRSLRGVRKLVCKHVPKEFLK